MNITYFIGSLTGGGAEHVICELASAMVRRGHKSEILIVSDTENRYEIDDNVTIKSLDLLLRLKSGKARVIAKTLKLFLYILRNNPDAYVVFLPETIRVLMLFRNIIHKPIIVSERGNPGAYSPNVQKQMIQAFEKADAIVFQTDNAASFYRERCEHLGKYTIIPNAICNIGMVTDSAKKSYRIVAAGRFKKEKNFQLLIRAFSIVSKTFPDYTLEIYGEGELIGEFKQLVDELKIASKVRFPGYVSNVSEHIKDADIFVLSSIDEGMPNVLIEAMSMGLPCVSTRCGGGAPEELIEDGVNGLLVPNNDIKAMAEAISGLISDDELRQRISNNSKRINDILNPDAIYNKWEAFLAEVIKD